MAIAKIIFKSNPNAAGETWMDATTATATAADITAPKTAMLADGVMTTGTGSGGGTPAAEESDVNFIDYDGTILYSYTAADFANLSALPANPSHSGLTAQGWNWSLADAKTYVANYGKLWIGQMYITDDGKTRVYIHLEDGRLSPMLGCCPNGTVVVDWGDGSATETLTGTSLTTAKWTSAHSYASAGDHVITLTVTSGSVGFYGTNSDNGGGYLLRYASANNNQNYAYTFAVRHIRIGQNTVIGGYSFYNYTKLLSITIPNTTTTIGSYAFNGCKSIESVVVPNTSTSIGSYAFQTSNLSSISLPKVTVTPYFGTYVFANCQRLKAVYVAGNVQQYLFNNNYLLESVVIPNTITTIGSYAFQSCRALQSISLPTQLTEISNNAFSYNYSLTKITLPSTVTTIGASAFSDCYGLNEIHFLPTTPPTVSNSNAWTNLPTDCIIYVPTGTLSAYTSATNYPSSSTYTYVEE